MVRRRTRFVAAAAVLALVAGAGRAPGQSEPVGSHDQEFPLDVDLDDRVDPVRPGEEIVFEVEVENFTATPAPDVVLEIVPPAGATFVVARREPDWAVVPAVPAGDAVEIALGSVAPCDRPGAPRCRDLWVTLALDPGVAPGTVLETRARVRSSDAATYPANEASTFTSAGSAAVRRAKVFVGRAPRDRVQLELDLARSGVRTRLDPPTPSIDVSQGVRVTVGEPGAAPLLDVSVPADGLRCTNPANDPARAKSCALRDPRAFRLLGLQRLQILQRPYLAVQRNNAIVRLSGAFLAIPTTTGDDLEVTVEAAGETYRDAFTVVPAPTGRVRTYGHHQGEP